MTEGPSLPPPRYSHTLHVEAPQPKPFAFLLGVALLAFAVPAGLVFAFLRFVSDAPPPAAEPAAEPAREAPVVAEAPTPAPTSVVFELDAGPAPDAAPAIAPAEVDAAPAVVAPADAAPTNAPVAPAPAPAPAVVAPAPQAVSWEMSGGILLSCRDTSGKLLDGFQLCGTASDLDHYLAKVVGLDLQACDKDVPTTQVVVRVNVDFGANAAVLDVIDIKNRQITGAWSSCLASKFAVADLAKIRHQHPKYTLTYRVTPRLAGEGAPR